MAALNTKRIIQTHFQVINFSLSSLSRNINISRDFSPKEFAVTLYHLKADKAPGPDSICPELVIHAGSGLKFWFHGFLSS